jgi:Flp pilus assembly protein TadD
MSLRGHLFVLLAALFILIEIPATTHANAKLHGAEDQVCDPLADYFLGVEDYPEAIRRHRDVIVHHPSNALAHYHLGFVYGVMGQHSNELAEYQRAIDLGLDDWQLFLNLGLLYLENGQVGDASSVLRLAAILGPMRAETHFNLALAYERQGKLPDAEQEALMSLEIDPTQPDVHNTLGAIYAEEGKYSRASHEWTDLVARNPDYTPARTNLSILQGVEDSGRKLGPADASISREN